MSQLKALASGIALTGTAIGPAVDLSQTPWGPGGAGRNGTVVLNDAPGGAATVKIQGHPGLADKTVPASGDAGWYDILTLVAASPKEQEIALPRYIRYNITVLGTGTLNAFVRGVQ